MEFNTLFSDVTKIDNVQRKRSLENDKLEEELISMKQDREHRKKFSKDIFTSVRVYVVIIMAVVFFNGFKLWEFNLDNSVLITLLSTTTANIVGLLAFVVRYLFHNK